MDKLKEFITTSVGYEYFINNLKLTPKKTLSLTYKYNPITRINNFTKEQFTTKLKETKEQFIETNHVFDFIIFKREEIDVIRFDITENLKLIPNSKHQGKLGDLYLFQIQTELDRASKSDTLLLSEKNATQLELHFKMILETLEEFELENTTKNKPDSNQPNWMKIIPLFVKGTVYDERNKNPQTSFTKIIEESLSKISKILK